MFGKTEPMAYHLSNNFLHVTVKPEGAELSSIRHARTGREYIWQADPAFWPRHAPVLFPIVGRVPHDQYRHGDQAYTLRQHGFARDRTFSLSKQEPDTLEFVLGDDQESRALYPFGFRLAITYKLIGRRLDISYHVTNTGDTLLPFSIGAHPAFQCPLNADEAKSGYVLVFDHPERAFRQLLDNGLRTGRQSPVLAESALLHLTDELFGADALIFKGLKSQSVTLRSPKGRDVLTVDFPGFPYLGIWTRNAAAPFICIEPWYGVTHLQDAPATLEDKEGIQILAAGAVFSCQHSVTIHE